MYSTSPRICGVLRPYVRVVSASSSLQLLMLAPQPELITAAAASGSVWALIVWSTGCWVCAADAPLGTAPAAIRTAATSPARRLMTTPR